MFTGFSKVEDLNLKLREAGERICPKVFAPFDCISSTWFEIIFFPADALMARVHTTHRCYHKELHALNVGGCDVADPLRLPLRLAIYVYLICNCANAVLAGSVPQLFNSGRNFWAHLGFCEFFFGHKHSIFQITTREFETKSDAK